MPEILDARNTLYQNTLCQKYTEQVPAYNVNPVCDTPKQLHKLQMPAIHNVQPHFSIVIVLLLFLLLIFHEIIYEVI